MSESPNEPVRLLQVDLENVGQPRGGGGPGSGLYTVPIKLSRTPSSTWARLFSPNWDRPPQWTTMHRPGIARVIGDRIILDGTTLDEVRDYHAATLKLVVEETNRQAAELERREAAERERAAEQRAAHERNVRNVGGDIRFD